MMFVRKIAFVFYRFVSSIRYRVRRRFTPAGLAVLGAATVTGVMSLNLSGSLSYQAFLLVISLLSLSWIASRFFRLKFSAVRRLPRLATVDTSLFYTVLLRNETRRLQTGLWLLEDLADPRPAFAEFAAMQMAEEKRVRSFRIERGRKQRLSFRSAEVNEVAVPPLAPGEETEVRLRLTPMRRGCLRLTGLTLARPDPLGLVKALAKSPAPQSMLVLPRRYPLPPVALPGTRKYQHGGVALASSVGESEEFVALRDYRHGDPLRRIHWRSWAKTGRPIVKEYEDEFFVRHALVLDTFSEHPHNERFEEAVSVAASFACTLQTQESLLDLLFVGAEAYCFTSGRGLAHTTQMLEILASVQTCRTQSFSALERLVLNHARSVSGCVCVFLAWDESRRQFVRRLRMLGVPVRVLVLCDPGEAVANDLGPMADAPHWFHVLELGRIEEGLARLE